MTGKNRDHYRELCEPPREFINWILDNPRRSPGELRVALAVQKNLTLWSRSEDWFTLRFVGDEARVSKDTVKRAFKKWASEYPGFVYQPGDGRGNASRIAE